MNFFYGTTDVHSNRVSKASSYEVANAAEAAQGAPQIANPNPLTDPEVIGKMNNLHCLSLFLTSRVGTPVTVFLADGREVEGILRNVGSDYFVVVNQHNNSVCPFNALNFIKME